AVKNFAQQGLTLKESLSRASDAMLLARTAGVDVAKATEYLTSSMASFNKEALTSYDIVNKLAAVSKSFSASQSDLAEAVQRIGVSASASKVSFDELIAAVASVKQATQRDGASIATALNTVFVRLQKNDVKEELKALGVQLQTTAGDALPAIQSLTNLANVYKTLSKQQQDNIAN